MRIQVTKPYFTEEMKNKILDDIKRIISSGRLSDGKFTEKFEQTVAERIGMKYAVATSSGTSAIEIILRSLDIKNAKVIVPTTTCETVANAVILADHSPEFVDIKNFRFDLNTDDIISKIENGAKVLIYTYQEGFLNPQIREIRKICDDYDVFLIEDIARNLGSEFDGNKAGSFGDAAMVSFYATKIITTGEGGMILTNDKNLAEKSRRLRKYGNARNYRIGSNWKIDEVRAAIGLHQMEELDEIIKKRNASAQIYIKEFSNVSELKTLADFFDLSRHKPVYYRFSVYLPEGVDRETFRRKMLKDFEVEVNQFFPPIHLIPFYKKTYSFKRGQFPVAEKVLDRIVNLPMFTGMTSEEIIHVVKSTRECIKIKSIK